ncbi:thioredoxin domain-containing protein 12-like [Cephus cinctus]|uniref:Thioredoxin domain-containing protein 12-like n=1 Tax=Cephus cinctus TaxID=211228 RepID=A0AAJ7BTB8_CEPCN|nr:thioredoxin domain-containing protein 12-like [Cephus cinctus]
MKFKNKTCILTEILLPRFIMVNVENSTEKLGRDEKFQPDGKYVPRILFYRPEGDLIREAYNRHPKNDPKYRYFYSNSSQVAETMLFVLEMIGQNALPKVLVPVKKKNDKTWVKPDDSSDNSIKPTILE